MDAQAEGSFPRVPDGGRSLGDPDPIRTILSDLGHELSRPLISLRAGFDLLLDHHADHISDDQRCQVKTMVGLCDDLLRLTRGYLEYTGLAHGVRPLHLGEYTIGALIGDVARQFAEEATAREIGWECALEGPDRTVKTDAAICLQAIGHLVENALKYTPVGGLIHLAARAEGPAWTVTVSDTGPGIPAAALPRVFEPFFRLGRDEPPGLQGHGLGLAVCREIVEQLGGDVTIHSEVGRGTLASVRLPLDASRRPGTLRTAGR